MTSDRRTLTTLISADGDDGHLAREGALVRHTVQRLDLKGVVGVRREVHDGDRGVG